MLKNMKKKLHLNKVNSEKVVVHWLLVMNHIHNIPLVWDYNDCLFGDAIFLDPKGQLTAASNDQLVY
jgi:hypothetical protein